MAKPVLRNGRLVGNPLAGGDLSKLSNKGAVRDVLQKAEDGKRMGLGDMSAIMKARREAGAEQQSDTLAATLAKMKEVFK